MALLTLNICMRIKLGKYFRTRLKGTKRILTMSGRLIIKTKMKDLDAIWMKIKLFMKVNLEITRLGMDLEGKYINRVINMNFILDTGRTEFQMEKGHYTVKMGQLGKEISIMGLKILMKLMKIEHKTKCINNCLLYF